MPLSFEKTLSFQNIMRVSYISASNFPSESSANYDMNQLPYISQSRSLLVVICVIMFFTASGVYMPLGNIQADYSGRCFLYTDLHFDINNKPSNVSRIANSPKFWLNPASTDWGAVFYCDLTTFVPVMVAILAMIIGWSTFTVWPIMMEIGKGGSLMLVYAFFFALCLGSTILSTVALVDGYQKTCKNLDADYITCEHLNSARVRLKPATDHVRVKDVHRAIIISQVASAALIGLSTFQIFISLGTFGIVWYHFNFLALNLYMDDQSVDEGGVSFM